MFWAKGYYVNTVGGNEAKIRKYIQEQEMQDQMSDQLSFREYEDPFKNIADLDDDSPDPNRQQKEEVKSNAKCGWRCSLRTFRCCWNNGPYRAVLQTPRLTWGYDCFWKR